MPDSNHGRTRLTATASALGLLFLAGCAAASSMNPLGFYVGGGVGQTRSGIHNFDSWGFEGSNAAWDDHPTAWNAIIGIRPLSRFAVEGQYIDFGATHFDSGDIANSRARVDAFALYAVGFLPIPLPYLDLFGKIGMARVRASASGEALCGSSISCAFRFDGRDSDSQFTYGLGAQLKYQAVAFRVEYLGSSARIGSPRAVMAELLLTF